MLRHLHIRNLAVVSESSMELGPGFNVLTGETGAGKSIVVDCLALLSGVRASSELIRTGADSLTVAGVFEPGEGGWRRQLEAVGVEAGGDELVIRREVSRNGKNRVFVNDQPVTLRLLAEIARPLLRIHGQREELGLVSPDLQRAWLDRLGGRRGQALLRRVGDAHADFRQARQRLQQATGDERARLERLDFLRFQLREMDDAGLTADEEVSLREERAVLRHSEAIRGALAASLDRLIEGRDPAYEALSASLQELRPIEAWEPATKGWIAELEEIRIRLGELGTAFERRLGEVQGSPGRLDELEGRLAELERLFRKYGADSREVLQRRAELAAELEGLEAGERSREALETAVAEALAAYRELAEEVSAARQSWSKRLVRKVERELADLALGKARFRVHLGRRRRADGPLELDGERVEVGETGFDQVMYQFSPNPGEELAPLAKVASGGELSRLYLAVQLAAGGVGAGGPTMVFDEVDAGIGGAEAAALGEKLARLAAGGQILAVTHLPQVASHGDLHFKVRKQVTKGRTFTGVEALDKGQRIEEVARMLGGSKVTELTRSHARELIG